jgi:polyisoprenyl-teichoic acid--peptidoglycan teichoic acid transferase
MRWRRGHAERPPRVGAAVLVRALAGVLTVFAAVTAGVAGAGYLQIPVPKPPGPPIPTDPGDIVAPDPDGPRTLLVLGSDRRAATSADRAGVPHSDTIVLLRLDPDRNRIAVLSLPRDLAVQIPGYPGRRKINEAYDHGGPKKTLATVKALFDHATGEKLAVNGVIDVNFNGFQQAVNALGGVYVDVDRDYTNPEGTGFASIDVKAGYQRLVGSDALAYVRYRHTDSDLFRNARQQEFLRQAAKQPAVEQLKSLGAANDFLDELVAYFRFDKSFQSRRNSAGMIKTALSLALHHAPVNQVALGGITESENPQVDTRLFATDQRVREAYDAFLAGKRNPKPKAKPARAKPARPAGLEHAGQLGEDLAVLASSRLGPLAFYFPELRTTGSEYVAQTPRVYTDRDEQGRHFRAYRLVIGTGATGEYYGVQGMTWTDPPLLASPDRVRVQKGRRLELFYDGSRLRLVAWRTRAAVYYVTNTLNRKLTNAQMLAIAGSLRRLRS